MPVTLAVSAPPPGTDTREAVDLVRRLGDHGYGACWGAEVQGPDAFTFLGALAATTELDLGVAVVPVQTRTALTLAMTALSLAELSGGRFALGIGASSEVIVERWAGQPFDRPLTHVRETYEAIAPVLRGEPSRYDGDLVTLNYRPFAPVATPVPLYLGALNQRSLRMVGELGADGLCLNQLGPRHVPQVLDLVREGRPDGELPDGFGVVARLFCVVTDDVAAARPLVKHVFAPYIATSVYNRFYRWMGYEAEARGVLDAAGDRDAMAAAISDELVDEVFLLGTPEEVAAKVQAYVDAGVTIPAIAPLAVGIEQHEQALTAIAAAWHAR